MEEEINRNFNKEYREKITLRLFTELLSTEESIVTVSIPLYLHCEKKTTMFTSIIDIRLCTFKQFYELVMTSSDVYEDTYSKECNILWDTLNGSLKQPIKVTLS